MFLWTLWWAPHALFELGESPLQAPTLFHPLGASLVFHTHAVLPALLSAPLQELFGLVPAYNLVILATFVAAGLGGFLLAHEITGDARAGLVAGAIFAFGHFRASMLPFPNLMQSQFLVLFAWALLRAERRASWRWAAAAGLLASCTLYSCYNLFVLVALLAFARILYALAGALRRREPLGPLAARWGAFAAALLATALPLLLALAAEIGRQGYYATLPTRPEYHEAVPLLRWIERGPLEGWHDGVFWRVTEASFLGWGTSALALFGAIAGWRRAEVRFWLAVALVFLAIAVGPRLNLGPTALSGAEAPGLRLPFHYLRGVPVLRDIASAHRFGLLGWVGVSALAGVGVALLLRGLEARFRGGRLAAAATALALLVVMVDFTRWPFDVLYSVPTVPAAVDAIARDPRDVAVLEFSAGRFGDPRFPYYETRHEKPVYLEGATARAAPSALLAQRHSRLRRVLYAAFLGERVPQAQLSHPALREEIARSRIGWVILSWDNWAFEKNEAHRRRAEMLEPAMAEVDRVVHALFPEAEVRYAAAPEELRRWIETANWRERREASCLYRVYRVGPSGG